MLSRPLTAAFRRVATTPARFTPLFAPSVALRPVSIWGSNVASTFSSSATEDEAMAEYFLKLDAEEAASAKPEAPLPIKLSGISGGLAADLYRGKGFDAAVKQLSGLVTMVDESPEVIARFFNAALFQPSECEAALDLLTTTKVNLKKYDAIEDPELREVIVGPVEGVADWEAARAKVKAMKLSPQTSNLLAELAGMGRLDLLRSVTEKVNDLKTAQANTVQVTVASGAALSAAQQKDIKAALPQYAEKGQNIEVAFEVDAGTLGGLMITMGNKSIDLTNGSRLMSVMQQQKD